jgi:hypothetical protein
VLEKRLRALRGRLEPAGFVWVSWPKKAARVDTDITEDTIREIALPLGFVDIKVCAVSEVWYRAEARHPARRASSEAARSCGSVHAVRVVLRRAAQSRARSPVGQLAIFLALGGVALHRSQTQAQLIGQQAAGRYWNCTLG